MSDATTPKQGDHVFNAIDSAIMRPFETIRSLRSPVIDGQQFIYTFLLHSYSLAKQLAEMPVHAASRKYVASAGDEHEALRLIGALRGRFPSLARVSAALLREIHVQNSDLYGDAAARFETEALRALQQALEIAVAPANTPPAPMTPEPRPGIAFQQMLNAAYDPAAALAVIADSVSSESSAVQSRFHGVIVALAETLDRPGMWRDPYTAFHEERPSTTGSIVNGIGDALRQLESLKSPGVTFSNWIKDEIANHARSAQAEADYGSMLHLVYARLQQIH